MLYYLCFPSRGFVRYDDGRFTHNIRLAKPYASFSDADAVGKELQQYFGCFAILSNCIGYHLELK